MNEKKKVSMMVGSLSASIAMVVSLVVIGIATIGCTNSDGKKVEQESSDNSSSSSNMAMSIPDGTYTTGCVGNNRKDIKLNNGKITLTEISYSYLHCDSDSNRIKELSQSGTFILGDKYMLSSGSMAFPIDINYTSAFLSTNNPYGSDDKKYDFLGSCGDLDFRRNLPTDISCSLESKIDKGIMYYDTSKNILFHASMDVHGDRPNALSGDTAVFYNELF